MAHAAFSHAILACEIKSNMADEKSFPLHDACEHADLSRVRYLVTKCHCDVNSRDELERTPLHKACMNSLDVVRYLCEEEECDYDAHGFVVDYFSWSPLHFACQSNKTDIVKYLLQVRKHDVNCKDNFGSTPMHIVCKEGHIEVAKELGSALYKCDFGSLDQTGNSPLHIACHYGHLNLVNFLTLSPNSVEVNFLTLSPSSVDVNLQNIIGDTPLHIACHNKHIEIIQHLVTIGCHVRLHSCSGHMSLDILSMYIPLELAGMILGGVPTEIMQQFWIKVCRQSDVDSLKLLKKLHGRVLLNGAINTIGDTPLHVACMLGNLDIVKVLAIDLNCDVNCQNLQGDTPLHAACKQGNSDIVITLAADRKCKVNSQNNFGDTPLHEACKRAQLSIVRYLAVSQHCEVNCQNKIGSTPLHVACGQGNLEIVKMFAADQRCKLNQKNSFGITPLRIACKQHHWDIVKDLVANWQCEVNCMNLNKDTVLHIACKQGKLGIVKILVVDRQCEVNYQNKDGNIPLHIACEQGYLDIVKILAADQRCKLNQTNLFGYTPMDIASEQHHWDIVQDLAVNWQCKDTLGNTMLHHACIRNNVKTVKIILSTGLADPQSVNNQGHTPAELTRKYEILQELSPYVARREQFSLQTYVKMFVMGNPAVGKSTLIKAVCEEIARWNTVKSKS